MTDRERIWEIRAREEKRRMSFGIFEIPQDETDFFLAQIDKRDVALKIATWLIDNLRDYSVGMSYLAEEKIEPLVAMWREAREALGEE